MTEMRFIGLSGKAGHGKNTVADILQATHALHPVAFANALKRDVYWALISDAESPYLELWEQHKLGPVAFIDSIKHIPEVRQLLQNFGQAMRALDADYWVKRLMRNLHPGNDYVIIDVRYPNEADTIRAAGGLVVRVERPGYDNGLSAEAQAHPSETALDDYEWFDAFLHNDGNMEQLVREVGDNFTIQRYLRRGEVTPPTFGTDADDLTLR